MGIPPFLAWSESPAPSSKLPRHSCWISDLMGWSCMLWNKFYKTFKVTPCKFTEMCHKTDSNGSRLLWCLNNWRRKYSHMEWVAVSAHGWCISFAAALTIETPLTRKKAHAVKEVSRPCDVSHMSAWKVCSHDRRSPRCPLSLLGWNVRRLPPLSGPVWIFFS